MRMITYASGLSRHNDTAGLGAHERQLLQCAAIVDRRRCSALLLAPRVRRSSNLPLPHCRGI